MLSVILFTLSVLLASVSGWGACESGSWEMPTHSQTFQMQKGGNCTGNYPYSNAASVGAFCGAIQCEETVHMNGFYYAQIKPDGGSGCRGSRFSCDPPELGFDSNCYADANYTCSYAECNATIRCATQCEADSANGCQDGYEWNSDSCKCVPVGLKDTTVTYCINTTASNGRISAYELRTCHCKSRNGVIEQCEGKTSINVNVDCPVTGSGEGSCNDNGKPDGVQPDGAGNDAPYGDIGCFAVTGSMCHFILPDGNTYSCDCDGSCDKGIRDRIAGTGCQNPYNTYVPPDSGLPNPPPNPGSSDSNPNSSDSNPGSSDSNPTSSDSNPTSSGANGGETGIYMDVLQAIQANTQETMNNTGDIKYEMRNIGTDVSHIRTNSDAIKENTADLNYKLNSTNSLLNDIKNKNWSPTINVEPPTVNIAGDTNIVNVAGDTIIVNADTAHAPFEILTYLKSLFGGDTTGAFDTTGWGSIGDSAKQSVDSITNANDLFSDAGCDTTGGQKCDNSIIGAHGLDSAKGRLKASFQILSDSLRNGTFADSLREWGDKFTGGQLSGSGSDNCPTVLSRNYHVQLMPGAGFDLTLGRYLCEPLVGSTTAWSLCRLLLRASVALACMWFLFKCATGFGGSDED